MQSARGASARSAWPVWPQRSRRRPITPPACACANCRSRSKICLNPPFWRKTLSAGARRAADKAILEVRLPRLRERKFPRLANGWNLRREYRDPMKLLGYVLFLSSIAAPMAYSQDTRAEYVAPPDAGPKGKAPRMKVQLLNAGEPTKRYAVIFYQGDEAFSGLLEFAEKYQITSAHFTAIGA